MEIKFVSLTDTGKVRSHNEDSLGYDEKTPNGKIFVVCDGMGGHVGGGTASRLAVSSILEYFKRERYDNLTIEIDKAFQFANEQIYAHTLAEPGLRGMGTTAVVLIIRNEECFVGHVGDSRIYIKSGEQLYRLTKDHSYVQQLVDSGVITDDQAENHPKKNQILKALGHSSEVKGTVCERPFRVKAGDTFMLCSDGLNGMLHDNVIGGLLNPKELDKSKDELFKAAMANGGLDNISILLVNVVGSNYHGPNEFRSFNPGQAGDDPNNRTQGLSQTQRVDGADRYTKPSAKPSSKKTMLIAASSLLFLLLLGLGGYQLWNKDSEQTPIADIGTPPKKYNLESIKTLRKAELQGAQVDGTVKDGARVECAEGQVLLSIEKGEIKKVSDADPGGAGTDSDPNPDPGNQNSDRDKDGVLDKDDKCPDEPGSKANKGCKSQAPAPVNDKDSDQDGVPDKDDKCPNEKGPKANDGCKSQAPAPVNDKDSDKDKVPDKDDKCPNEQGSKANKGCPEQFSMKPAQGQTWKQFYNQLSSEWSKKAPSGCKVEDEAAFLRRNQKKETQKIETKELKEKIFIKINCN